MSQFELFTKYRRAVSCEQNVSRVEQEDEEVAAKKDLQSKALLIDVLVRQGDVNNAK
jgi:hypothetical protein